MSLKEITHLPEIETKNLTLRRFKESDVEDVFEYASNPEVTRYAPWNTHKTIEESKNLVKLRCDSYANRTGAVWGIYHKKDSKIIGSAGFITLDKAYSKGEMGYTLSSKYWGNGYATEVINALIEFGFNKLHLHRIEGICHVDNIASTRVMEKGSMKREGTLRGYYKKNSVFMDVHIYAIIKND